MWRNTSSVMASTVTFISPNLHLTTGRTLWHIRMRLYWCQVWWTRRPSNWSIVTNTQNQELVDHEELKLFQWDISMWRCRYFGITANTDIEMIIMHWCVHHCRSSICPLVNAPVVSAYFLPSPLLYISLTTLNFIAGHITNSVEGRHTTSVPKSCL
jgi:hypothetical protein